MKNTTYGKETLYDIISKKKTRCRIIGIIAIVSIFIIGAIVTAILGPDASNENNIFTTIMSGVVLVLLIVGIVFLVKASRAKKSLKEICPYCHDEFRIKVNEVQTGEEGYLSGTLGYDERTVKIEKRVTEKTFDVTYECPSCGEQWNVTEKDNYEIWTPFGKY